MTSCKDFGLLRLTSGRVLYRGRGVMLGLKGSTFASNWTDLPIIKSPKIMQMSTGHEGYHVCFVSEDGVAYFAGVSKRGEDGESSNFCGRIFTLTYFVILVLISSNLSQFI